MSLIDVRRMIYGLDFIVTLNHGNLYGLQLLLRVEGNDQNGDSKTYRFNSILETNNSVRYVVHCQLPDHLINPNACVLISLMDHTETVKDHVILTQNWIAKAKKKLNIGSTCSESLKTNKGIGTIQVTYVGQMIGLSFAKPMKRRSQMIYDFDYWTKLHRNGQLSFELGLYTYMAPVSVFGLCDRMNMESFSFSGYMYNMKRFVPTWEIDWNVAISIIERMECQLTIAEKWKLLLNLVMANHGLDTLKSKACSKAKTLEKRVVFGQITAASIVYKSLYTTHYTPINFKDFFIQTKTKRRFLQYLRSVWPCIAISAQGNISYNMISREFLDSLKSNALQPNDDTILLAWHDFASDTIVCKLSSNRSNIPPFEMTFDKIIERSWNDVCINHPEIYRPLLCLESVEKLPLRIFSLDKGDIHVKWQIGWICHPVSRWEEQHLELVAPMCTYICAS